MPAPRIYPPDISTQRRKEQRLRTNLRYQQIVKLFRENYPRLYQKAHAEATEIINKKRGPLPGGTNEHQ